MNLLFYCLGDREGNVEYLETEIFFSVMSYLEIAFKIVKNNPRSALH